MTLYFALPPYIFINYMEARTKYIKEGVQILDNYINSLRVARNLEISSIMGVEGNAARVYFQRLFYEYQWKTRRPRIKADYLS